MTDPVPHFSNLKSALTYAENTLRMVPGLADLHRMAMLLLAENTGPDARVLVVGAGGGMELKYFAENQPGWHFDGVDPAPAMLTLAKETLGPLIIQVTLHQGYVETAPQGPFDAACCLLVLHFLSPDDRLQILHQIRQRLKPGAAFVMAHHSIPTDPKSRALWSRRFAAFDLRNPTQTDPNRPNLFDQLPILPPAAEEALLQQAGFTDITLFYAAFSFRGWVAYA